MVLYKITNTRSGAVVASGLKDKKRARNKCDKLDNEYGAYAHLLQAYASPGSCESCMQDPNACLCGMPSINTL